MAEGRPIYGIIAEFDTPADAMHAAEKVRDAGFRKWDVYTPYPVHGMDKAMGLKNSKVGWFAFIGGVTGYTSGMLMIVKCTPSSWNSAAAQRAKDSSAAFEET